MSNEDDRRRTVPTATATPRIVSSASSAGSSDSNSSDSNCGVAANTTTNQADTASRVVSVSSNNTPELGYFLLEEEPICFLAQWLDEFFVEKSRGWLGVDVSSEKSIRQRLEEDNQNGMQPVCLYSDNLRCLKLYLSGISTFDGRVQSVAGPNTLNHPTINDNNNESNNNNKRHHACRRSDLSCLLGMLKLFPEVVQIQSLQVLPLQPPDDDDTSAQQPILPCAVVVTVGFPQLSHTDKANKRHIVKPKGRTLKPLHSALQLILATVRSDWGHLERTMERLQRQPSSSTPLVAHPRVRTTRQHHFPTRISLGELYLRMESSFANNTDPEETSRQLMAQPSDCHLLHMLPRELLAERIAPFLRAKSLDAWRGTCSFLHSTLRAVVPGLQTLRLYAHQVSSLAWMRRQETRGWTELDVQQDGVPGCPDGDWHRAVTGGRTTLLRTRDNSHGPWRVSQWTGAEWNADDNIGGCPVARGGLLADEPGLGKTITVLSLILQTLGLTTHKNSNNPEPTAPNDDNAMFRAYWKESCPPDFRRKDLSSLINSVVRNDRSGLRLQFWSVRKEITRRKDSYTEFEDFETDVLNEIEAARVRDPNQTEACQVLQTQFLEEVEKYKAKQIRGATKAYRARPGSAVAALFEAHERQRFLNSLVASKASLLVVPVVLQDHWRDQIKQHVDLAYTTTKEPLVFEFHKSCSKEDLEKVSDLIWSKKTHGASVFIDRAPTKPLPEAKFLAAFHIVITSNSRLMHEWKHGSFQEELKLVSEIASEEGGIESSIRSLNRGKGACPLLKIHWLRVIVDEGHSMAKSASNASVKFASWISAERRWAMTGTPTKQTTSSLSQILALVGFLQHDFFSLRNGGEFHWKRAIAKPWKDGDLSGFYRLRSLLRAIMKRHTKLDILELPPPVFKTTEVEMSPVEVDAYNSLVTAVQINLVLTSLTEDSKVDSLLHPQMRKHANQALGNVRRVCVGYSRVIPTLTDKLWDETIFLAHDYSLQEKAVSGIRNYLARTVKGIPSQCECCGISLTVLLLSPCCGCLVCTDCVSTDVDSDEHIECLICQSNKTDVNRLQRFQPGFVFAWIETLQEQALERSKTTTPTGALPTPTRNLTNQQNAAGGENGSLPLIRPPQARQRTRKFGDGHECSYDRFSADGKCTLCLTEHDACNLVSTRRCETCHRVALDCPKDESKSTYLVEKLLRLIKSQGNTDSRSLKVIVYSQYRGALNLVGNHLLRRFGAACVAEYWGRYRTQELNKFSHSPECFVMLLSKDGSEGLDLSFVTHIFFLEEIWELSQQEQAVARAWRMGAKGRVQVETLIAEGSVEETMAQYEREAREGDNLATISAESKDYKEAKTHALLKSLRYLTQFQSFKQEKVELKRDSRGDSGPGNLRNINEKWKNMARETLHSPPRKRPRRVAFGDES